MYNPGKCFTCAVCMSNWHYSGATTCFPLYTAQLWWNHKKTHDKQTANTHHIVYNNVFRLSKYESTSMLCTLSNIPCCQAVIINIIFRLILCRLQKSNNAILQAIQGSSLVHAYLHNTTVAIGAIHCMCMFRADCS